MTTVSAGLRWGFIGASTIADEALIPAIRESGGELSAIHSRSPVRARELAARHGIATVCDRLDTLLDDTEIDAVFISSTNERHCQEVLDSAAAGKHILCEKPLAMSVPEAREMVQAARAAQVVLAVNHQQREQAVVRALRDLVRSGTLGPVRAARLTHAGRLREDLRTWRLTDPVAGAGVELDLTVHDADLVRFLLEREAVEVVAMSAQENGAAVATHTMALVRMDNGVLVSLHEGFNVAGAAPAVEIMGDLATATCVGHTAQVASGDLWLTHDQGRTRERVEVGSRHDPYLGVIQAFNAAVDGEGAPSAGGEDGLRSLQIALAAREAALRGETVTIELGL